ncbi:MAG: hypothetical protein IKB13_05400 [Clostridia bacterium]|nr:hypothetical protein [Clostridia bacterium]
MKKCLSALLSVLLIFSAMSCMLLSVSAASLIDKIYLTGINVPAPDRTGDYFVEYGGNFDKLQQYDDDMTDKGVTWYDVTEGDTKIGQTDPFIAGHQYRVTVLLEADSGWQFKNGAAAYVNGNKATTYTVNGDDGDCQYIGVTYTFPVCEYTILDTAGVTIDPLPRPGMTALEATELIDTVSADYRVNMLSWYNVTDGEEDMLEDSEKLESSNTYRAEIWLRAAPGYKFRTKDGCPDVTATVNGNKAEQLDIEADNVVCLLYDFYIPHPNTRVDVYNLDTPVAGAAADTAVTLNPDCGYKVTKLEWFDSTDPLNNFKVTRFEAGKTYTVEIELTAIGSNSFYVDADGYQDVDCYINGYTASSYSSQENDVVIMYKHWELPAETNDLLILKAGSGYVADHENRICTILAEQSKAAVSANIENEFYAIADANKAYVGTGSSVQVLSGNQDLLSEYTVLVRYDADGDGKISAADARLALRASVGLETLNGIFFKAADADGDGALKAGDARTILRKSVGLD